MLEKVRSDPLIDVLSAIPGAEQPDFWSFKHAAERRGAHALLHYPAMMVPNLQGTLLQAITQVRPETEHVLDPFVGSGTTLVEAMDLGLAFSGIDINPLAALACKAKSGPYLVDVFTESALALTARIRCDASREYFTYFPGQRKWLTRSVSIAISRIARAIESESELWLRRLFWLALARVVRAASNSRMSTYKLHIKADTTPRSTDPLKLFEDSLGRFLQSIDEQHRDWTERGVLARGRYKGTVSITLGDNRSVLDAGPEGRFDAVVTSPPYGDNATTIPYGQYAYLPLQWIASDDIECGMDPSLVMNTHSTDSASLGGSLREAETRGEALSKEYTSAKSFLESLGTNAFGRKRFASFFCDLDNSLEKICNAAAPNAYFAWTVGSRRIAGRRVPMEVLLSEMLAKHNVETIGRITRTIHSKKMAMRNSISDTMCAETIVIAKKKDLKR